MIIKSSNQKTEETVKENEVVLTLGGKPEEASISLRFFGDELEPDEITKLLKRQPTEAYKKGETIPNKYKPRIGKTGTWHLHREKDSDKTLEEQISDLFEELPKDLGMWKSLATRFDADIYCGAWLKGWNRDIWLSPDVIKEISDRGLHIGIAIYCDCEDEEEK